jgi:hypothetical protein
MPVALPSRSTSEYSIHTGLRNDCRRSSNSVSYRLQPGSTPSGNMNFVVATACIKWKWLLRKDKRCYHKCCLCDGNLRHTWKHHYRKKSESHYNKITPLSATYAFGSNLIDVVMLKDNIEKKEELLAPLLLYTTTTISYRNTKLVLETSSPLL